jgi:hypothetical protein
MPRVPKKVPKWLQEFNEYARSKEKRAANKEAIDVYETILEQRWDRFVAQCNENAPPAKKRKTDPLKTLENAMKKVAAEVDSLPEDGKELMQVKERLLNSVPPQVQVLLQSGPEVSQQIEQLYLQTAESKTALEQLAATVTDGPFKQGALDAVAKMYTGLETIKTSLHKTEEVDEEHGQQHEEERENQEENQAENDLTVD